MEHKQGLKELNDLDKMVTLILTTQQLSEQNARLEGDESLNFGELVKHIWVMCINISQFFIYLFLTGSFTKAFIHFYKQANIT